MEKKISKNRNLHLPVIILAQHGQGTNHSSLAGKSLSQSLRAIRFIKWRDQEP